MAIATEDYALIAAYRDKFPEGDSCAILGDCNITGDLGRLGFKHIDTFDILGNPTHKVNLSELLDEKYFDKYDWVIDPGTLYCCFNVSMVLKNITRMLKDTGCCLHTSNLCGWFGRGFYSISPSLYKEFYELNNFTVEGMGTKTKQLAKWNPINTKATFLANANMEFSEDPAPFVELLHNDTLLYCFVSREKKIAFKEPIPEHYVINDKK